MDARIRQLEKKLSELLGEQAWREPGLSAPEDIDALKRQINELEQKVVDLTSLVEERTGELQAARAANREMMARLNIARRAPGDAITSRPWPSSLLTRPGSRARVSRAAQSPVRIERALRDFRQHGFGHICGTAVDVPGRIPLSGIVIEFRRSGQRL
jgi:hypothetical protein